MSPYEAIHGEKPDLSKFRPYGCRCYLFLRKEQRQDTKFGVRGEPAIHLGRCIVDNQSAYLVRRQNGSFVTSNHVTFDEQSFPYRKKQTLENVEGDATDSLVPDLSTSGSTSASTSSGDTQFPPLTLSDARSHDIDRIHSLLPGGTHYVVLMKDSTQRTMSVPDFVGYLQRIALTVNYAEDFIRLAEAHSLFAEHSEGVLLCDIPSDVPHYGTDLKSRYVNPKNRRDALNRSDAPQWLAAEAKEFQGLEQRGVFQFVDKPCGADVLPTTMVYTYKNKDDGSVLCKARLCARGDRQTEGVNYNKYHTYSAVLNSRENRMLLALAAANNWSIFQSDITQGFTYGSLDDVDVYLYPPAGYPCPPGKVLKCVKSIYGLRQSPAKFHARMVSFFSTQGYEAANGAKTIFIKREGRSVLIHALFVDDFLHFTNDTAMYQKFRKIYEKEFDLKVGDALDIYLGNRIRQDRDKGCIYMDQEHYCLSVLEKFGMQNCAPVHTPMTAERLSSKDQPEVCVIKDRDLYREQVGSLNYLANWTRPDISYACSELSRFMSNPGKPHLEAAKRVFRYLKGTSSFGLEFRNRDAAQTNQLWGYVDADWAGNVDDRRSTSGYVLMLNGAAISWKSKRQPVVALSTAESEFIAASTLVQEVVFLRRLLTTLGFPQEGPTRIFEDNESCIAWAEGSVGGAERAKHMDLRKFFVHDAVKAQEIQLVGISSARNAADIFTKSGIPVDAFRGHRKHIFGH